MGWGEWEVVGAELALEREREPRHHFCPLWPVIVRAMGRTVRLGLVVLGMVRPNPVLKTQGKAEARIIQV